MAMESSAILIRMPRGLPRGGFTYKDELEENDWECPYCGKPISKPA